MDSVARLASGRLLASGVAGTSTSHGAEDNLYKIEQVIAGNPAYTFGMEELLRDVRFEEAYDAVASHTGYPPDTERTPGRGCIDPARTAAGLIEAGRRIREVAGAGGRVVLGTGHPGALLIYYLRLSAWVQELGGQVTSTEAGGAYERGAYLDWVDGVAVLANGASLLHTHSPEPMKDILRRANGVDLVVADHGFAGAAVAAGVPAVTIMDTNDPAVAVTARRGCDLAVVTMDDNRDQNSYLTAFEVLKGAD